MDSNSNSKIVEVSLYDLLPSPIQPRKNESVGIEALKKSILEIGLINKPKVITHPKLAGKFIIQTGHRRVKAMKELSFQTTEVELLLKEDDRIPLVDNLLREDLHIVEIANSIGQGIEDEIFFSELDVSNSTGIELEDVKKMILFGNKFPEYVVNYFLENSKEVYSRTLNVLVELANLSNLSPGKKSIMSVLKDLTERELEQGANVKLFISIIRTEIDRIQKKIDEKKEVDPVEEEVVVKEVEESDEVEEEIDSFLDLDEEFQEEIMIEKTALLSDYNNEIKDLGLVVRYDDDWREISLTINLQEMSNNSITKALSILEKLNKKLSQ